MGFPSLSGQLSFYTRLGAIIINFYFIKFQKVIFLIVKTQTLLCFYPIVAAPQARDPLNSLGREGQTNP